MLLKLILSTLKEVKPFTVKDKKDSN